MGSVQHSLIKVRLIAAVCIVSISTAVGPAAGAMKTAQRQKQWMQILKKENLKITNTR